MVPLLVWCGLVPLATASLCYAYLPAAPLKLPVGILVAAGETSLIVTIFMQLRSASPVVRVAAACGLGWLDLLFIFSFADSLTR